MTPAAGESHSQAWAFGEPEVEALFKQTPGDFQVTEELGFALTGSGEHACLRIRKTGVTTQDVVRLLARRAGIREFDVGYGGLKDRQGVCEQWFSLYQPVPAPLLLEDLAERGIEVLESCRNSRKLRRGSHRANRFRIRLRDPQWCGGAEQGTVLQALQERLALVARRGVPNYFGEQRFGRDGGNVDQARQLFAGALRMAKGYKRGLLLSSARSQVFNAVLSQRVQYKEQQNEHSTYTHAACTSQESSSTTARRSQPPHAGSVSFRPQATSTCTTPTCTCPQQASCASTP